MFNNSLVKHKDEVFRSPQPQLSEDAVNRVRGRWTSGKLWRDGGGVSDQSPLVGGICPLFFFSASGCWYIFIIRCWSSLPPQHIEFSSESLLTAVRHILSGNELQQDDTVDHLNASIDGLPPRPSYLKKTCCGPLLGLCARPVSLTLSLWNTPAMSSGRRRGGFLLCVCAGLPLSLSHPFLS